MYGSKGRRGCEIWRKVDPQVTTAVPPVRLLAGVDAIRRRSKRLSIGRACKHGRRPHSEGFVDVASSSVVTVGRALG